MELTQYKQKVSVLSDCLKKTNAIAAELKMTNSANQISSVNSRLGEEVFRMVVVGEFSRGKSTFVNALLRNNIFPAYNNPTTAIISKVVYGRAPRFQIYFKDEKTPESLTEEKFKQLIAADEPDEDDDRAVKTFIKNQEFFASIDHAEISYPLEFCKDGVEIVDTPGTNDLNVGRMEITYGYLNRADAVVLLLSATQPLTKSESQFLRERILGNQINDIFFVVSHKDDLNDASEERKVLDFVTDNLRKILPPSVNLQNRIFLVSGLGALLYHLNSRGAKLTKKQSLQVPQNFKETGFPELEATLGKFLAEEKGNVRIRRYGREISMIIGTMQHDLSINIGVVSHSADEIRAKVANFEKTFKQSKERAHRVTSNMQTAFNYYIDSIDSKFRSASADIIDRAQNAIENITEDMSASEIQHVIENAVTAKKKSFIDGLIQEWQNVLSDENQKAQEALAKIWSDIDITYKREFSLTNVVESNSAALAIVMPEEEQSAVSLFGNIVKESSQNIFKAGLEIGERVTYAIGFLAANVFLVGAKLYESIFGTDRRASRRNSIRSQIYETYQAQSRETAKTLKEQFKAQTAEICDSVQSAVEARIDDMEKQLKDILTEKESKEQDAQQQCEYLNRKLSELKNANAEVARLIS